MVPDKDISPQEKISNEEIKDYDAKEQKVEENGSGLYEETEKTANGGPFEEKDTEDSRVEEITESDEIETLKEQIDELQQEKNELFKRLQRLQADFDNYRKRMQIERQEMMKYAAFAFTAELLSPIDNLERALDSAKQQSSDDDLVKGLDMILRQFLQLMECEGITPINAVGQTFDPVLHEAVMQIKDGEKPSNIVVEELQKGYKYKDRVLRASRVKVTCK